MLDQTGSVRDVYLLAVSEFCRTPQIDLGIRAITPPDVLAPFLGAFG